MFRSACYDAWASKAGVFVLLTAGTVLLLFVENVWNASISTPASLVAASSTVVSFSSTAAPATSTLLPSNIESNESSLVDECPIAAEQSGKPVILLWKIWFHQIFLREFTQNFDCPYECAWTLDSSCSKLADLHVFHACFAENPPALPAHALRAYWGLESPHNSADWKKNRSFFDLSVSYRSTATVYNPYGRLVLRDGTEKASDVWSEKEVKKAIMRKKSKVLLSISNCREQYAPSGRMEYVRELEQHINITQTGACFKNRISKAFLRSLIAEHHFFLAFENSVCPEYTTEKFWRLKDLIVPVVLSRGVLNPHHVPNGTFIAASDFESPQKLAEYLDFLVENKHEYEKFFEWTKHYRKSREESAACRLCELAIKKPTTLRLPNVNAHWNRTECIADYGQKLINRTVEFENDEARMRELVERTSRRRAL